MGLKLGAMSTARTSPSVTDTAKQQACHELRPLNSKATLINLNLKADKL